MVPQFRSRDLSRHQRGEGVEPRAPEEVEDEAEGCNCEDDACALVGVEGESAGGDVDEEEDGHAHEGCWAAAGAVDDEGRGDCAGEGAAGGDDGEGEGVADADLGQEDGCVGG